MGLLSKKKAFCRFCGKEFTYRSKFLYDGMCDDCRTKRSEEKEQLENVAAGYIFYNKMYMWNSDYSNEDLQTIIDHRGEILSNNAMPLDIDIEATLKNIGARVNELTLEEKESALAIMQVGTYKNEVGAVMAGNAIAPNTYPGVLVDARDVFAVCYEEETIASLSDRLMKITVLTNDPYIPVFTYFKYFKVSALATVSFIGERKQKKKETEDIVAELQAIYPNLKYPVVKNSEMKKLFKKSAQINGTMPKEKALDCLSKSFIYGCFEKTNVEVPDITKELFELAGYVSLENANDLLEDICD